MKNQETGDDVCHELHAEFIGFWKKVSVMIQVTRFAGNKLNSSPSESGNWNPDVNKETESHEFSYGFPYRLSFLTSGC